MRPTSGCTTTRSVLTGGSGLLAPVVALKRLTNAIRSRGRDSRRPRYYLRSRSDRRPAVHRFTRFAVLALAPGRRHAGASAAHIAAARSCGAIPRQRRPGQHHRPARQGPVLDRPPDPRDLLPFARPVAPARRACANTRTGRARPPRPPSGPGWPPQPRQARNRGVRPWPTDPPHFSANMCSHMTSDGSPYSRLQRSIRSGNLPLIHAVCVDRHQFQTAPQEQQPSTVRGPQHLVIVVFACGIGRISPPSSPSCAA
jgi:hypothetical protein